LCVCTVAVPLIFSVLSSPTLAFTAASLNAVEREALLARDPHHHPYPLAILREFYAEL